jgi:putative ABC transport system permease protein
LTRGLVRLLLRLYPAAFRERYGEELAASLEADRRRAAYGGARGALRFWLHTLRDLSSTAWQLRRESAEAPPSREHAAGLAWTEVLHAWRALRRHPSYAATAIVTLGLGVGATTAVFSVVHGVLLRPLPYREPDRLVQIVERRRDMPDAQMSAYGSYTTFRDDAASFESVAIWAWGSQTLTGSGEAIRLRARAVSASLFPTLGISPALGRGLRVEDEEPGSPRVTVLSDALWRSRFGADPAIVGRSIRLDDVPHTVVGVMPPGFDFPGRSELWVPLAPLRDPTGLRRWHRYRTVGRLAAGRTLAAARAQTDGLAARLAAAYPDTNAHTYFDLQPLAEAVVGRVRPTLQLLLGAVGLLLLGACANVANLGIARVTVRQKELDVRIALGASRARLALLLTWESLLLGAAGGVLGWLFARGVVSALVRAYGDLIPRSDEVSLDGTVLAFAVVLSVATGLAVALFPVLREARAGARGWSGGLRVSAPRSATRLRRTLAIGELALAVILTSGALLLARSLVNMNAVETGVRSRGVLAATTSLPEKRYPGPRAVASFFERFLAEVERLPNVERAAATLTLPVDDSGWRNFLTIRGRPVPEPELPAVSYVIVSPGYFETLGVPLLGGRDFRPGDGEPGHLAAVVNRTAAERFWPGESPLGREILGDQGEEEGWADIVGVVADVRQSLTEPPLPEVYVPIQQVSGAVLSLNVLARLAEPSDAVVPAIRRLAREIDPDVALGRVATLDDRLAENTARPRLGTTLVSLFAGCGLVLACIGVYGVLACSVSERRKEMGIRMAVGADRAALVGLVLKEALAIGGVAVLLGSAGALASGRLLRGMLFGVTPQDPTVLASVVFAVTTAALVASLRPALSAASVDPVTVLRDE